MTEAISGILKVTGQAWTQPRDARAQFNTMWTDIKEPWDIETWKTIESYDPIWFLNSKRYMYEAEQGIIEQKERLCNEQQIIRVRHPQTRL